MASATSSSNMECYQINRTLEKIAGLMFGVFVCTMIAGVLYVSTRTSKKPEFTLTSMNITKTDSNSSTAIAVAIHVRNPTPDDYYIPDCTVKVYVIKDGGVIGEATIPPLGQGKEQTTTELKARLVVANGNGVGFPYWSAGGGDSEDEKIRVLYFDVWAETIMHTGTEIKAKVKCEGVGVGFPKGAAAGFMVDHVKSCLLH